ncbi:MAG: hypothetical protein ACM3UZ_01615 [Acidobacteriota bacterium]
MRAKPAAMVFLKILILTAMMFASMAIAAWLAGVQPTSSANTSNAWFTILACFLNSSVIYLALINTGWHGVKVIFTLFILIFGIQTVMAQLEAIFFNAALSIPQSYIFGYFTAGAISAAIFSPFAAFLTDKLRRRTFPSEFSFHIENPRYNFLFEMLGLSLIYTVFYFVFGYLIAWQYPAVRHFYSSSSDLQAFMPHMINTISHNPWLFPFQILRGFFWSSLALLASFMIRGERWVTIIGVALLLSVLYAANLLIPNPYMPGAVRTALFIEIMLSNFLFGSIAGLVYSRAD